MDDLKKEIKTILKDAGVDKPTKVLNQIMKTVEEHGEQVPEVEQPKEEVEEDTQVGVHRNQDKYIHRVEPKRKSSNNAVTSIELINDV